MLLQHIGIIMDGNRRFAKQLMKKPWMGHKKGVDKAMEVLEWSCKKGIRYMTAYALSVENIHTRPKKELNMIFKYFMEEADNILANREHIIHKLNVNVKFIGRLALLPEELQERIKNVEAVTRNYKTHFLNIAVAYGGQQEIVDATKKILEKGLKGIIKPSDLNEELVKESLYTNGQPSPDLIIRTGGEKRLSNFLSFQSAYSELVFTDSKWPELQKKDFESILEEFTQRKRRFGA